MTGSGTAAYGMYSRHAALPDIVHALNGGGFENEDICMVLSPAHPAASAMRDTTMVTGEKEERAKSALTIGWFSEFGAVVIPTVGFFIRSQAFFRALVVEQNFLGLSRAPGTLADLGFPEHDAKRLGRELSYVGALVYVSCREPGNAERASELLHRAGAREAASLGTLNAAAAVA